MSRYPDEMLLVHMNIPGSHESATWNFSQATKDSLRQDTDVQEPEVYRCQSKSILDLLEMGVRFFDLRYAVDPTFTDLVFWHNEAL